MEKLIGYGRLIDGVKFCIYRIDKLNEIFFAFMMLKESHFDKAIFEENKFKEFIEKIYKYAFVYILAKEEKNIDINIENMNIIGLVAFYANDMKSHSGFITMIVVDQEWQRYGFGKELIEIIKAKCKENGMKILKLWVHKENRKAREFYKTVGFEEGGEANEEQYWAKIEL